MRKFSITGLCVPQKHYMVDISNKLEQIKSMVLDEAYFTINRGRQYGKTTTLFALESFLEHEYTVISISFGGMGEKSFKNEENFCQELLIRIRQALELSGYSKKEVEKWKNDLVNDFSSLSRHITQACQNTMKPYVLMIDEVDKASNNLVFINFLNELRDKFLLRRAGKDFTFHSVILAGVYDIRNLKWKIKLATQSDLETIEQIQNSPWNIAVDFNVDMSFNPDEIKSMLISYEGDHNTGMDLFAISNEIYKFTSGYPFLVSRICKCIDEVLDKEWSIPGVHNAIKLVQEENNTLFDDLYKNLNNNPLLSSLMRRMLIDGEKFSYNLGINEIALGVRYGYFSRDSQRELTISNQIFEKLLVEYFVDLNRVRGELPQVASVRDEFIVDNKFDMQACLERFAKYYPEIYSKKRDY